MNIAVVSDTHAKSWDDMPKLFKNAVTSADAVIHAGDIGSNSFYGELEKHSNLLYAVLGNNDNLALPRELEFTLEGIPIALIHGDQAPYSGRESWLLYRFPDARLIIYGHSHAPFMLETGSQTLINPGSVKRNRTVDYNSFVMMEAQNGSFGIEFIKIRK